MEELAGAYRGWIEEAVAKGNHRRDGKWTESIAVGSESFVNVTREKPGIKAKGRNVFGAEGSCELRESSGRYESILGFKNRSLSPQNAYYWNYSFEIAVT